MTSSGTLTLLYKVKPGEQGNWRKRACLFLWEKLKPSPNLFGAGEGGLGSNSSWLLKLGSLAINFAPIISLSTEEY